MFTRRNNLHTRNLAVLTACIFCQVPFLRDKKNIGYRSIRNSSLKTGLYSRPKVSRPDCDQDSTNSIQSSMIQHLTRHLRKQASNISYQRYR